MREYVMERLELEADLRRAVKNDELTLHYQIISSLKTNHVVGFEALVRWNHPQRGLLQPAEFIPFAEETGQIIAIDRWVMERACKQLKDWQETYANLKPIYMSVNMTTSHLIHPDIIDFIQSTIQKTQLAPDCLRIEITESAILEYTEENAHILQQIRDLGVQVQIDDFGIGYSSLSYLSKFPINGLKIDNSFINTINTDNSNLQIVQAIISLSNELGIGVVAEGIEDRAQLDQLKKLGCEFGQGYYLSYPMDRRKMKAKLEEVNTNTGILC
jgi:EAL domain-containing protein (putative c-di-GMP-specific phosphodiesterase class I)